MRSFDGLTEQMVARSISLEEALLSINLIMDDKDFTIPGGENSEGDETVVPEADKKEIV